MRNLTPVECRVVGVLVEKALTTPAQYPLTLNAIVSGANQRNNREPILELGEEDVLDALDTLRGIGLVREVSMTGSRVPKYRHDLRESLSLSLAELVVLTELLLRGPQTAAELRQRAGRMHPLETVEVVSTVLAALAERSPALVRAVASGPGSRAERFAQCLCPDLHPLGAATREPLVIVRPDTAVATAETRSLADRLDRVEARLRRLESELGLTTGDD